MSDPVTRADELLGDLARRDVPIGPLTTYRVGGSASLFVEVRDEAALHRVADAVAATGVSVLVVGKGSNLLVADRGFEGLAVRLGEHFAQVRIDGTRVRAGGAATLPVVARRTVQASLEGFEWAVGVPGSIGGAVRMNAGGHGSDMAECLRGVRVVDLAVGEDVTMPVDRLELGYRRSAVRPHQLVVSADLELRAGDRVVSEARLADVVRWRREHQPGGPNAGSVFTNPPDDSAGRLVDVAGCKGTRMGSAAVSTKHANFILADPGGAATDVLALMAQVRERVAQGSGIWLVPETRLVGFTDEELASVGVSGGGHR